MGSDNHASSVETNGTLCVADIDVCSTDTDSVDNREGVTHTRDDKSRVVPK